MTLFSFNFDYNVMKQIILKCGGCRNIYPINGAPSTLVENFHLEPMVLEVCFKEMEETQITTLNKINRLDRLGQSNRDDT